MNYRAAGQVHQRAGWGRTRANGLYGNRRILSDWTVRDLGFAVEEFREPPLSVDRSDKLIAISPNSPLAMARLMEDAWDQSEKKLEGWRSVVGEHPTFLAGMARHLVKAGKPEDAERRPGTVHQDLRRQVGL